MGFAPAAVALVSAAVGAVSAVQQQQARQRQQEYQENMARYNAQLAEQQAGMAEEEGRAAKRDAYDAALRKRQEAAGIIGRQRAQAGASGAQTDQGSALDLNLDTAEKGEIDALALQQQGLDEDYRRRREAWTLRSNAQSQQAAASALRAQRRGTSATGTATLLNGLDHTGNNFRRLTAQLRG